MSADEKAPPKGTLTTCGYTTKPGRWCNAPLGHKGEHNADGPPYRDEKAPPKGALEEAVSLFDELRSLLPDQTDYPELAGLDSRRAALEPRLAKRRENQAKGRGGKP